MTHDAPQLSHGRPSLAPKGELLASRTGKGGTYGVLWVLKCAIAFTALALQPTGTFRSGRAA